MITTGRECKGPADSGIEIRPSVALDMDPSRASPSMMILDYRSLVAPYAEMFSAQRAAMR